MIKALLNQWKSLGDGRIAMLCSVVQWKGSVPRKDYPMMLVLDDGTLLGTIGGGSMELKVSQAAQKMISKPSSTLFDFDMTGNDVDADVGLCGGTLKVLVEPFSPELETFYSDMLQQSALNMKLMVKLHMSGDAPTQVLRQIVTSRRDIEETEVELEKRLKSIFENQLTRSLVSGDSLYLMWQVFSPPMLHIFGAGHVGQAVAQLAHFNELQVKVYDDRTKLITPERFPHAERLQTEFPINREAISHIPKRDFILIASREHKHDRQLLSHALDISARYIGLVSSARKWKLLSENLHSGGFTQEALAKVHAPVGIDIDAQTVPEIAISILSEIISVYRGKSV
ncbi:MAG: XdhC family protein [Candidatus Marinimicrobia bacterium]|jgi:xanthine dehydrogenase accessory factor|nr:XdhC family protein [Candidatus Neomarinimicrobiota bacterium]MBT3576907.1 XdhC family protein [Candidatus Neomarinimicrobiota bacterium]MBT3681360.1 XdhC family protein [Candidatus Neomarinimicrobiota bacterium]MBT3951948.1 XdhC family protein [Candidatus Neomarinimicrobiota bacterium]MBT4251829.1 XdhC family protein [Candidatus Neomarinimicrobiota bacterium]